MLFDELEKKMVSRLVLGCNGIKTNKKYTVELSGEES